MAAIDDRTQDSRPAAKVRAPGAPLNIRTLALFAGMVLTGSVTVGLITAAVASLVVPEGHIGLRPYLVSSLPAVLMLFIAIVPALWCGWFWRQIFPSAERPQRHVLPRRRRASVREAAERTALPVVPRAQDRAAAPPPEVAERAAADLRRRREERERQRAEERRREEERLRGEERERREARRRARAAAPTPPAVAAPPRQTPLERLRLPKRVHASLAGAGIETIEQLTSRTRAQVLEINGIGAKSLEDIVTALDRGGLVLRYPERATHVG